MASGKGMSPWAWAGIGCLALAVLLFVGMFCICGSCGFVMNKAAEAVEEQAEKFEKSPAETSARIFARLNPDIEFVDANEETGEVTLKNLKTNDTVNINYKDLQAGKLEWSTTNAEGETSSMKLDASSGEGITVTQDGEESRTVTYGASAVSSDLVPVHESATIQPKQVMSSTTATETSGAFTYTASAATADILEYYKTHFEGEGYEVTVQTFGETGLVSGEHEATGDKFNVTVATTPKGTNVTAQYTDKK